MSEQQGELDLEVLQHHRLVPVEKDWGLPEYDPAGACPKCRSEAVGTRYHQGVNTWDPCWENYKRHRTDVNSFGFPEHLDRLCNRCGYRWAEATS